MIYCNSEDPASTNLKPMIHSLVFRQQQYIETSVTGRQSVRVGPTPLNYEGQFPEASNRGTVTPVQQ